VATTRADDEQK